MLKIRYLDPECQTEYFQPSGGMLVLREIEIHVAGVRARFFFLTITVFPVKTYPAWICNIMLHSVHFTEVRDENRRYGRKTKCSGRMNGYISHTL